MFSILYYIVHFIQPFLVPICFVFAWIFVVILGWSLISAIRDTLIRSKEMHEIPCANCQFFTNDHRLKCTVHPAIANTEKATKCLDYSAIPNPFAIHSKAH